MLIGSTWSLLAPNNADGSINGLIPCYNRNPAAASALLQQARANGQTAVSLGIWFYDGAKDGFALDSMGGALNPQSHANLWALAFLVKSLGFSSLMLRFGPEGANNPRVWSTWQEPVYQTNWNFIIQCVLAVESAAQGLPLMLDLHIEGIPRPGTIPQQVAYLRRLWADISIPSTWNKMPKTVSFIPEVGILQQIPKIFDTKPLDFLAPDIYGPSTGEIDPPYPTFYDGLMPLIAAVKGTNHESAPWYVTESFMNDWDNANWCARVVKETGIKMLGFNQWPNTRASQQRAKDGLIPSADFDGQPVDATAYVQTLGGL